VLLIHNVIRNMELKMGSAARLNYAWQFWSFAILTVVRQERDVDWTISRLAMLLVYRGVLNLVGTSLGTLIEWLVCSPIRECRTCKLILHLKSDVTLSSYERHEVALNHILISKSFQVYLRTSYAQLLCDQETIFQCSKGVLWS